MAEHRVQHRDGFDLHLLRTREAEVEVVPALGAKIAGLRSRRTGREWMWAPPGGRLFRNGLGDPFSDGTRIGADECFPTVAACAWRGRELPDHGEAWSRPWEIMSTEDGISLRLECPVSPFVLSRRLRLEGNRLTLSYEARNLGADEEAYTWAFHPLLALAPGDRIEVPASSVRADLAIGCPLDGWERRWNWPAPLPGLRLDALDFGPFENAAAKLFAESLSEGRAALANERTGERLEFAFDLEELDTLGVWINRGGWGGFHHVAIEPANGAPDRLDVAAGPRGRCRRLAAGATAAWGFTLTLS